MTLDEKAERVAAIARQYAFRERNGIAHSGHTVTRLLQAVGELIGHRITSERIQRPKRSAIA